MSNLTPPRNGIPIAVFRINGVEYEAQIHPEWLRYLANGLFERVGGATGSSTSDLLLSASEAARFEESQSMARRIEQDMLQAPAFAAVQENLITTIADLQEQIAVLRTDLEGLRQGTFA